jgi:hypothetical protein
MQRFVRSWQNEAEHRGEMIGMRSANAKKPKTKSTPKTRNMIRLTLFEQLHFP